MFHFQNVIFYTIVLFLNANVLLLFLMGVFFMLGEIFWVLIFPFNLPSPLFNAVGSIFSVTFAFKIMILIQDITAAILYWIIQDYGWVIYGGIFVITLIIGYIVIFANLASKVKETVEKVKKTKKHKEKKTKTSPKSKETKIDMELAWDDVGNEIKAAVYDLAHTIRSLVKKESEKKNHAKKS
jgi:hypothetical protein